MARFPSNVYNPISLFGAGIALVSFGTVVIFFLMDVLGYTQSPYLGIFTYMIIPAILIAGLLMIPLGMLWEQRRLRKQQGRKRRYFILDFNQANHRTAAMVFMVGTMLLVVVSAAGTYQAYNYSESVEFCGEVCHTVMMPEYVAYQNSPHARVPCAECHIGEGADWFVKAKVSGMYQVYSVMLEKYHRPIKTPIENLRPARETCEECHWPSKFSSDKKIEKVYFPLDTTDSQPWKIVMDLKIGGGHSELGPTEGIHWHMNEANVVRYIATDRRRQEIPWIETALPDGSTRIYRAIGSTGDDTELKGLEVRRMDCIDCHNRPSHIYYPPFRTLNDAIAQGQISQELPNIRAIASHALTRTYASEDQALRTIPSIIRDEYSTHAPDVLLDKSEKLEDGIAAVLRIYSRNFFPSMEADWRAYPNNIGHMYDEGCFRCHDNRHVSDDGHVLTNDCALCHTIITQGPQTSPESDIAGLAFRHPADIDEAWRSVPCSDCHLGD
ncbi:MAG: cytochrome C [Ignavibacteria bacterium]|nr:MAG: cytochrome C [Ignavibacteria bacterium]